MAAAAVGKPKKAKKAPKKLGDRVAVGEKIYTKESCHRKEKDAKTAQAKIKEGGKRNARIKQDPVTGSFCVISRKKEPKGATAKKKVK